MGSTAAFLIAKQNQYILRFKAAGAVSLETAVNLPQAGCRDSRLFQRMVGRGIFKSRASGKYYLDQEAIQGFRKKRLERALIALLSILAFAAVAIWFIMR